MFAQSSLTLSLLRCIHNEGSIFYDGVNTKDVNLDILRSHITIIPQIVSVVFFSVLYPMPLILHAA